MHGKPVRVEAALPPVAVNARGTAQRLAMRPKPASIGRGAGGWRIPPSSITGVQTASSASASKAVPGIASDAIATAWMPCRETVRMSMRL